MDRYLQAASDHPQAGKKSVITTSTDRMETICDSLEALELRVKFIPQANGYCLQDINRAPKPRSTRLVSRRKGNSLPAIYPRDL
jgi:hypothetical protein